MCEDKRTREKISTCAEEDRFHLFYQLSFNPPSDLEAAEIFYVIDPFEAEQNRRPSLRNTRAHVKRQVIGEQARRQTRNSSLRSRKQQETTV